MSDKSILSADAQPVTAEDRLERLLKDSEFELRKISRSLSNVGNCPHYPMFLLWDSSFPGAAFGEYGDISAPLQRIWPQGFRYLVNVSYRLDSPAVRYSLLPWEQEATLKDIRDALSRAQRARDVFAEMGQWRLYNIIDTTRFQSAGEFEDHYNALSRFREVLNDADRSMLIVLLDDSRNQRETAGKIREFLSRAHGVYDSTVLVSNLTRDNWHCRPGELRQIAAGILTISNNDAVFDSGGAGFQRRTAALYNGGTFVVSYYSMERPNREIALQIHQTILDAALKETFPSPAEGYSWNGFLTTDTGRGGRNLLCEETAEQWPVKIDADIFESLPLRAVPRQLPERLGALPYSRLRQYTFSGILDHLAGEYGADPEEEGRESDKRRANELAERWKADALEKRPLPAFRELTDEQIDRMVGELDAGSPRETEPAQRYFEDCVRIQVRERILYPRLKQALSELRARSAAKAETLAALQNAYRHLTPTRGFEQIGTVYERAARDFLREPAGQDYVRRICSEGDSVREILDRMLECFRELVSRNREQFSLSFMDEWMRRLRYEESRGANRNIYRTISGELTGKEDSLFHLRGNYPLGEKRLRVFLLHTADLDGNHPTELYEHLRTAFASDPILQYLNTGDAGAMEAFTFLSCEGENLLL